MKKIVINGQFFLQKITGQQRYAGEILLELDKIAGKDEITAVVPQKAANIPQYKNIKIIRYGGINSRMWEQINLAMYLIKTHSISLNLCNTTPFIKRGITVIHDIAVITHKEFFTTFIGKIARLYYSLNQTYTIKGKLPIITVSEFSKKCIIKKFNIDENKVIVIPSSWQHFNTITPDDSIFCRYSWLEKSGYIFSLGSLAKNKNFEWVYTNAKYNPNENYIIAGNRVRNYKKKNNYPPNIHFLENLSDGEIKSLMTHCKAFLFPSLFEGFGLPPLEALSVGAPIIVSNAASLPEIYEDAASYIDPCNPDIDIQQKIKQIDKVTRERILNKYSFEKSARMIYELIINLNRD